MNASKTSGIVALILAVVGVLLGQWVLLLGAELLAFLFGNWIVSLSLGLFADMLFGMPTGMFRFFPLPFTSIVLVVAPLRLLFMRQLRSNTPERL